MNALPTALPVLPTVRPLVLVTGVGGPAGRAVVPQLLARGLEVVGTDMAAVDFPGIRTVRVPRADAPAFVPVLTRLAAAVGASIVIPTVTEEIPVLARHAAAMPLVVASPEAAALANDKWLTVQRLRAAGVAVPRSELLQTGLADPCGWTSLDIGLPMISKPRVGRGGRGVTVHTTLASLAALPADRSLLLQEFAPGTEYAVNLYRRHDGRDASDEVAIVLEKTALANGSVGNGTEVRVVSAPDVAAVALVAADALGLRGPVDVDVRRRADGTPVVLECNARFGAHSATAPEVLGALLAEHLPLPLVGAAR